ncbi:MAG: SRPBCC family protein [Gemmatimonadaceae bacterium]|nr:SRPBCC family protein [Gemmatimonadaceae bacterium]
MKTLIKLVILFAVIVLGGAYLYGRGLPRDHIVSSNVLLVAPADSVYKVIRNIEATPSWWSDVKAVSRIQGAPREAWVEDLGAAGKIEIEVTRAVQNVSMVVTILNAEEQGWGGVWYYEVRNTPAGTEVTITEEGFVDSPVFRTLMKLRGKHRTVDSYLRSLGAHFGEQVTPRHG